MALSKRDRQANIPGVPGGLDQSDLAVRYPCLYEHLAVAQYDDGTARKLSTLTLFVDQGGIKACLNDRDQGLTGWISAESLAGLLDALETALADDRLDWRRSERPGGKGKK